MNSAFKAVSHGKRCLEWRGIRSQWSQISESCYYSEKTQKISFIAILKGRNQIPRPFYAFYVDLCENICFLATNLLYLQTRHCIGDTADYPYEKW